MANDPTPHIRKDLYIMATMVLKDMVLCPVCGAEMFPCAFDSEKRVIAYRCRMVSCLAEQEYSFEEVKLGEDERFHFVCLNDDGNVTWKCYEHGYCDYHIEHLLEMDFTKFERCCCILGRDEDDLEADLEYAQGEGRERIQNILHALDEESVAELGDDMLAENPVDIFDGDYVEAFVSEAMCNADGVDDFIEQMLSRIYDLFEINIDADGNILEDEA